MRISDPPEFPPLTLQIGATNMTWAQPADIIDRWTGSEAPAEDDRVLIVLIGDAEDIILGKYPSIQTRITSGQLTLRRVQIVLAGMVQRAYQTAQDGRIAYSNGAGPFSESGSYGDSRRGLFLTKDEIALLAPPEVHGKAFSIDLDANSNRTFGFNETGFYNGYYYQANSFTGEN
jgi:hypothetical protein